MAEDDELLVGTPVRSSKDARDTDGDGGSDVEEELAGTDPNAADPALKGRAAIPPRTEVDGPRLEREVAFDPAGTMPAGQSLTGGLDGLTNLDGSAIPSGTNHHGVGEDALLQGRDTHSPLDMERSPLGSTSSQGGPAGADLGFRAPNMDLVSADGPDEDWLGATPPTPPPPMADPPAPPPEEERDPPPPPPLLGDDPDPNPRPDPHPTQVQTNPDADGGAITDGQIDLAIVRAGGDTTPVEGQGAGPQIDDDQLRPDKRDLVTDPGDEDGGGTAGGTGTVPGGRPDAPVVRTINPDSGVLAPPTGGPPPPQGGGDTGHVVDRTAADLGGDGLQSMDGIADLSSVADDHLEIDAGNLPDHGMEHDTGDLGGPLDDGFD